MTAARQKRKALRGTRNLLCAAAGALLGAALLGPFWLVPAPSGAATTERIVVDHHTGLAISGFDPVAYFVDGAAAVGRADLELRMAGAVWRFRNQGNRAAFGKDPGVYLPRFGGHDPMSVARGGSAHGHPEVWMIVGERLYLFYSPEAREAFAENPAHAIAAAERSWPEVLRTLTP